MRGFLSQAAWPMEAAKLEWLNCHEGQQVKGAADQIAYKYQDRTLIWPRMHVAPLLPYYERGHKN